MTSSSKSTRYCTSCGTPVFDPTMRFCQNCGALIPETVQATTTANGQSRPSGLDGVVNQYIQDRMRESSAAIAHQVKQEIKTQVRHTAQTQLQRNGGKIAVYAAVGLAGLIVVSAILSLITHLLTFLLPFALVILVAYLGYMYVRTRLPRH